MKELFQKLQQPLYFKTIYLFLPDNFINLLVMSTISKPNLEFLKNLKNNNNREWFTANKATYELFHQETIDFAEALLYELNKHDDIETPSGKKSLMRIYRDVRFSKDKTPYKNNWGGGFRRATQLLRGGYYYQIQPSGSFVGGGFWGPNAEDLLRIRKELAANPHELRKIITSKSFINNFGELKGDQLKTAPKGFDKEHEAIDLLRYKQFIIGKSFSDKEVLQPNFYLKVNETFQQMRPFLDYMSYALTTDENGESLY